MLSARHDEPRSNQGAIQAIGQGRESKDENESQAWKVRGSGVVPERLMSSCTVNCQLLLLLLLLCGGVHVVSPAGCSPPVRLVAAVVAVLGLALVASGNDAADRAFLLFDSTNSITRCVLFFLFTVYLLPRASWAHGEQS